MGRETLFRGISKETNKWVYGYLLQDLSNGFSYIIPEKFIVVDIYKNFHIQHLKSELEVDTETVTQFTDLYDSTTWEDLTEEEREKWTRPGRFPSEWKGKRIFEGDIIEVDWNGDRVKALVWFSTGSFLYEIKPSFSFHIDDADNPKVIGKKIDNPELLK